MSPNKKRELLKTTYCVKQGVVLEMLLWFQVTEPVFFTMLLALQLLTGVKFPK